MIWNHERHSTLKGIAAGAIGGLFASWVMNQFQSGMAKIQEARERRMPWPPEGESSGEGVSEDVHGPRRRHEARRQAAIRREMEEVRRHAHPEEEPANEKAAVAVSEQVFHHEMKPAEKKSAGSAVHYIFGAAMGGLYGFAAEHWDPARAGGGTAFGAALWFGADEVAVPSFKLSKSPLEYPASMHANALSAHIVYGATTELVRRALRAGVLSR